MANSTPIRQIPGIGNEDEQNQTGKITYGNQAQSSLATSKAESGTNPTPENINEGNLESHTCQEMGDINPATSSSHGSQNFLINESNGNITESGKFDLYAPPNAETDTGVGNSLCDSLQILKVSGKRKRLGSVGIEDEDMSSHAKRREIAEAINEGIIQIGPGNWGDVGFGVVANDEWL
ncbi:hypothetical protein V6N11_012614 [Hibiscus sabdariffa]|uniref:Uncharacterized protein n=1 Tax=Hibiscus sabdariffa TaxID=183260 RepID=A0ABR2QBN1_9ROSI